MATIPTLRMMTQSTEQIEKKADMLFESLRKIGDGRLHLDKFDLPSRVGGGALPLLELDSKWVRQCVMGEFTVSQTSLGRDQVINAVMERTTTIRSQ